MQSRLFCLLLGGVPSLCLAQQPAAPLGLEIGKATCSEAARKLVGVARDGTSVWANGPILRLPANAGDLQGLKGGRVICDEHDQIVALIFDFDKGGNEVNATANQLSSKYQIIRRNLPPVGNGFAEWRAANGSVEIDAPHLSFNFSVRYWAAGAKAKYETWDSEQRRQRDQKKAGSL